MRFSDKILSQTITELCFLKGIDHIVISPGSRNAPLTLSFANDPRFKTFSIVDERCAAFFALGLCQQLKKPVAVVCTSGSALLNFYPAVAEAFYSDLPLVVISADRPADFIDIGDGQTIRQEGVFENHILYSANCKEGDDAQIFNETEINIALNTAIELQGPVHINVPFSEPLYQMVENQLVWPQEVPIRKNDETLEEDLTPFLEAWNSASKKIILIGTLPPNSLQYHYIQALATNESMIVFTENTSNLHHENFFPAIDQLIAPLSREEFKALQPDVLLTFGGMVVSKKVKTFLRDYPPKLHWHVDFKKANDTFFVLNHHFKTTPNSFFKEFLPKTESVESTYKMDWLLLKKYRLQRHDIYENEIPFSDFKVFSTLFKSLPSQVQLQLSNSATIRYAQLFPIKKGIQVFCNRGTSGIDGCTSTAIGAAFASKLPTVFITGDLGFFYDSNALWNNHIPKNFKIIVVNNGGGGIFKILPGETDSEIFKTYFETKHDFSAKHLCEMHGFEYASAANENELESVLDGFYFDAEKPKLLEIFTPSEINAEVLLGYFEFIK